MKLRTFEDQEWCLRGLSSEVLLKEIRSHLVPILTHKEEVSTMSVPGDFERDDDLYILGRISELKRRVQ